MTRPPVPDRYEVLAEVASTDAEILLRERDRMLGREVFLTSGRGDEAVSDGTPGGHSLFMAAFLRALDGREPLTSTMLFAEIQRSFTETDVGHMPQFGYPAGSPAGGEFLFFLQE